MTRRVPNYQTISWFRDLWDRGLLDLEPPYQRKSVWSSSYKSYFIETILLQYPAPPIFLHEDMSPDGAVKYAVVDGKQRLTSIFEFLNDEFSVADAAPIERLRGKYFSDFPDDDKRAFHSYVFAVEYISTTDEGILDQVFDRLNRNVARLSRQELRHARFSGEFATLAEEFSTYLFEELPKRFPHIAPSSARQMKDVEYAAILALLVEKGPTSTTPDDLDEVYAKREDEWVDRDDVARAFRRAVGALLPIAEARDGQITITRLRNQGDFYALFGAVAKLHGEGELPSAEVASDRLVAFMGVVSNEDLRDEDTVASDYYTAARSAANDLRQRSRRIEILRRVIAAD